ncbi:Amino acid-binding ACT:MgtC/SapB transporter [Lachnospiraceae bacterium TWA4]|nr:Amino acid-binding ACT:MgtC/SapB transporter [Lachnospiraceae bacterium TWA4]
MCEYVDILLKLSLALVLGGLLGLERTQIGRAAGLRTYAIVCCASSLIMMTNLYIFHSLQASDPVRLGAQVISGIGFLGAGSILITGKYRHQIKGLTTAAALWSSGAIGIACGCGYYFAAITATLFILFAMHFLKFLENKLIKDNKNLVLYMELDSLISMTYVTKYFLNNQIVIDDMRISRPFLDDAGTAVTYVIVLPRGLKRADLIQELAANHCVIYIEETY